MNKRHYLDDFDSTPWSPVPLRPERRPQHGAVLRGNGYTCPACGPLGDLTKGIRHAVANQYPCP